MTKRLSGKAAIVTGGSRGIGAGIVKRLASEGARVAFTYGSNAAAAESVVEGIVGEGGNAYAFKADASDPNITAQVMRESIEKLGGLDILVHNAGTASFIPIEQGTFEAFRALFKLNVDGVDIDCGN